MKDYGNYIVSWNEEIDKIVCKMKKEPDYNCDRCDDECYREELFDYKGDRVCDSCLEELMENNEN